MLHQGADGINSAVRAAVLSTHSGSVDVAGGAAAVPSGLAAYLCTVPKAMLRDDPVLAFQTGEKSGMASFLGTHPRKRVLVIPADSENFQIVAYRPEDRWVERFTQSRSSIIKDVPAECNGALPRIPSFLFYSTTFLTPHSFPLFHLQSFINSTYEPFSYFTVQPMPRTA
jgi:hypothetical protein